MNSFQLRSGRGAPYFVVLSAAVSVAVLGGTAALFAEAAHTPVFVQGSTLAAQAAQCPYPLSKQARHECLRDIAAAAIAKQETVLVARFSDQ